MTSHSYNFSARQVFGIVSPIAAVFLVGIVAAHLADWAGWIPLRADIGGVRHQAAMAHTRHPAEIVFVGDSTCWCGIDASAISNELPGHIPAINLSVFSWFDLVRYAQLADEFAAANPRQVKWVVLLVCANKLSRTVEIPKQNEAWHQFGEEDRRHSFGGQGDFFSGPLFRERLAQWVLPETHHGRGAVFFGFNRHIGQFMTAHNGGIFDFGDYVPNLKQKAEDPWKLRAQFEPACRDFKKNLPPGVKLAIGVIPSIIGTVPPDSKASYLPCLQQWNGWIQADLVLTNLPVALPTSCFAPGAHLNVVGQKIFTTAVAKELSPALR